MPAARAADSSTQSVPNFAMLNDALLTYKANKEGWRFFFLDVDLGNVDGTVWRALRCDSLGYSFELQGAVREEVMYGSRHRCLPPEKSTASAGYYEPGFIKGGTD